MPRLSAVLIVKNEAQKLRACLDSLRWVDEIVILDSGSDDETPQIAQEYSTQFYQNTDWQGFGVQRQRAADLASGDWIFMIDADERVTPELRSAIESAINQGDAIWHINRLAWCFGRFIKHSGLHPDWIPRLYPKDKARFDETRVHERLVNHLNLPVRRLKGVLLHYIFDSVRHQQQKAAHYAEEWAIQKFATGKRTTLVSASLHALACFLRMYVVRAGFLDGKQGYLLAVLLSQATFAKYAELWRLQQKQH